MSGGPVNNSESELKLNPQNENEDRKIVERTKRWVSERSPFQAGLTLAQRKQLLGEWNARREVAKEIERDIKTGGLENRLTAETVAQRAQKIPDQPAVVSMQDTITGETFYQIVRKDGESLVAEERSTPDLSFETNLISQAKLGPHGQTEFTLIFTGERFKTRDANPNIAHSKGFPNSAVYVFDTLKRSIESAPKSPSKEVGFEPKQG